MKAKHNFKGLFVLLLFLGMGMTTHAQSATQAAYRQKDFIGDNPTADRDIQIVSDYLNALAAGDLEKARSLMADTYKALGPGMKDSLSAEKDLEGWREGYKTQSERKTNFVMQTFRVLSGDLQGNWVSVWGDYNCTVNGQPIKVPFQSTFHVMDNGKIDRVGTYYDRLAIMETLGFQLVPPAPKKAN